MAIHIHRIGSEWFFDKKKMHKLGQLTLQYTTKTEFEHWYSTDNSKKDIEAFHEAEAKAEVQNDNVYYPY